MFLNAPGGGLAESASELASFASVDAGAGGHQEWRPILEGELAKARDIQVRGHRPQTPRDRAGSHLGVPELAAHWAQGTHAGADALTWCSETQTEIELEKALHRWTEVSWFLDEAEVATAIENGW